MPWPLCPYSSLVIKDFMEKKKRLHGIYASSSSNIGQNLVSWPYLAAGRLRNRFFNLDTLLPGHKSVKRFTFFYFGKMYI